MLLAENIFAYYKHNIIHRKHECYSHAKELEFTLRFFFFGWRLYTSAFNPVHIGTKKHSNKPHRNIESISQLITSGQTVQ